MSAEYDIASGTLIGHLHNALSDLTANPFPPVPNPPNCTKRASVALIIRLRPNFSHWPSFPQPNNEENLSASVTQQLDNFFSQPWSQRGDPEILFIKRAARSGDRWTSHVALPGGKRDPDDADDRSTAIRETMEEVGIDLNDEHALFVGNLPERIVTTSWGKVPLMVLCPFVFLLTRHDVPSPKLQPTEVGSTHWVSLRALLSPSLRTSERADVSDRLARRSGPFIRGFLRLMLGQMLFAAVRLIPTESLYCSSAPGFLPDGSSTDPAVIRSIPARLKHWWLGDHAGSSSTNRPLLLWGLTLGILADFLEMLPPHNALSLWTYPTFTPLDVRWITWAVTYSLRKRKRGEIEQGRGKAPAAVEEGLDAIALPPTEEAQDKPGEVGIGGLGVGRYYGGLQDIQRGSRSSSVGVMLDGYYDLLRKAVFLTFVSRLGVSSAVGFWLWRQYLRPRR